MPQNSRMGLSRWPTYVRAQGLKFGLWFEVERAHRELRPGPAAPRLVL